MPKPPKLSNLVSVYHNAHFMISLRGFHIIIFVKAILGGHNLAFTKKRVIPVMPRPPPILLVVLILYGKRLTDFEN